MKSNHVNIFTLFRLWSNIELFSPMKKLLFFLSLFFSFNISNAQNLSNQGKEFWVGYGHNALFDNVNNQPNSQEMVLYLGATQPATVTVTINGTTYSQIYNIAANSVIQSAPLPKSGVDDARLVAEGLNTKGIHIVSDVPIVAYAHQYGLNSSGATMLMPVETYGFTYYSLNYTQLTNVNVPCYSWFYAIASENNTRIEITPSVTTNSGRAANVPFSVNLNKGEIYNVFGESVTGSGTGLDVTGSKMKSIAGSDGKCHKIAVFSGSSRITICGNSGDILQQQIFPSSAWGTNYLTYPTINTNNINQTNLNYFRVAVRDPTTKVKRNGTYLTGLTNNFYYEYSSSTADFIEANKPVLVSQYVPSMQNCPIYDGNGDPEMFYLSPLQQAVNQASFYSTGNQNILDNYVAIIVKNSVNAGITVDGSPAFNVFIPHPQNPGYSIAIASLAANQQHTIVSDSAFTAITYGFGQFESYGFNAGTNINNLDILPAIKNTFSNYPSNAYACPKSPFNISVRIAYRATKMVWKFSQTNNVSNLTPRYDTTFINPVVFDSSVIDGRIYYRYNLPNNYVLSDTGTYNIPLSVTAPEIDNCNNTLDLIYPIVVRPVPSPSFSVAYSTCKEDTAIFLSTGITGIPIKSFDWLFDDGTRSAMQGTKKNFPTEGTHPVKLTLTTYEGCIVDTIKNVVTNPKPIAPFGIASLPACEGATLTFSDSSYFGGRMNRWYWDFGNGQKINALTKANQTSSYPAAGIYTVKHLAHSSGFCYSDTVKKIIQIFAKPKVKFGTINGCLADSTVRFFDSSTISDGQALTYLWHFGDPNFTVANPDTSILKNPVHKYIVSGTYPITLTVTTANGCGNSYNGNVTIYPQPTVSFNVISPPQQCVNGNSFAFNNTSAIAGGTISYKWLFGDGVISLSQNAVHSYVNPGVYNVKLVITSDKSCKDSILKPVTVYPKPTVGFNVNTLIQCVSNNLFVFTNVSSISSGLMTYKWDFGDGNTSVFASPNHVYSGWGNYTVKLVVTSDKGCKDSASRVITVNPQPSVAFSINNTPQCLSGNNFVFTNTSSVAIGTVTYSWLFGDGATSPLQNPAHVYTIAGTFKVKLIVTSGNGCKDSLSKSITVLGKPTAAFSVNNTAQCITGNAFVFTNSSSTTTGTLSYQWSFGDGSTSILTSPFHNYLSAGIYTVKLVVTTSNGCKDSLSSTVTVNPKPAVSFSINNINQCLQNNNVVFTNTSSVSSGTMTYQWQFGDGGTSTLQNPSHVYTVAGTYNVKLIVTSDKGCKDSVTHTTTINPKSAVAFTINTSTQCITGNNFTFSNTSSISTGTLTYQWTFGDGTSAATTNASHTYTTAGSYAVKLVVTTNFGCKDSLTQSILVGARPSASFNINNATQCVTGNNFSFANSSSITSGTMTYDWSFGDGGTSVLQNPAHSYIAAGSYVVRLIATSDKGCKDTTTKTVTVNYKPLASFTINTASQCLTGNNFVFTGASTITSGGALGYQWIFGDGGTSSVQNPSHNYLASGIYQVRLVATSVNGCTDTAKQTITVSPKPTVSFSVNVASQCLGGNNFVFTNNSSVVTGTINYQWSFGDGAISALQNPIHNYTSAGTYSVRLIVTSDKGCIDSFKLNVSAIPKPTASFNVNSASQCFTSNNFVFTNTSVAAFGTLSYQWSFGDGGISTTSNPSHTYAGAGTYSVKLITTAGGGCKDSITVPVTVNPKPVVAFNVNTTPQCFKANNFSFANTSNIASGTLTYGWSFGDGGNSTLQNPGHIYTTPGTYTVKLVAISDKGCKDSTSQTVVVNPSPIANFTINNTLQCLSNNNFVFTNTSTLGSGSLTYQWTFGDGAGAVAQNATHTYLNAGTYSVKLVITSNNGCKDSISQSVVVNPKPAASFTVANNAQCLVGNSFLFTGTSTVSSGTMTYLWSFGDGQTSVLQNPVHSYSNWGNVIVKLIVTTNNGCKDSTMKTVFVYQMPVALFSVNSTGQCLATNNFSFTNTSSALAPASYSWSFGDGGTSVLPSPTHVYLSAGIFKVKLITTSATGCTDSLTKPVTVYPIPTASFNINLASQCFRNNSFVFSNTSTISSGSLLSQWNFGDGNFSNSISPLHSYTTSGTYVVKLVVTTGNGCKDSISQTVDVIVKPIASFTINNVSQCKSGNNYTFTNTSVFAGTATYQWSFGDGGTSVLISPSYQYAAAGTYTVRLILTTNAGCKDTVSKTVTVFPQPTVLFNINSLNQCLTGNQFIFTNQSSVAVGTYNSYWSFGDGMTSTVANPTHSYTVAGTYTVSLLVMTNNGCRDSISQTVKVNPQPAANFSINANNQCFSGNNFIFTNTSVGSALSTYKWSFGDGSSFVGFNASHVYSATGIFQVKLIVTSADGCVDSTMQNVTVNPKPFASFTSANAGQCLNGNNFTFANTSSVSSGSFSSFWSFGDGITSTAISPSHVYTTSGTFIVKLIVTTNNGCKDSTTLTMNVFPMPTVSFTINNANQCFSGNSFSFNNTSSSVSPTIYSWTFGDGSVSSASNPTYSYPLAGTYSVKLIVTSGNGCKDSISNTVTVSPKPTVAFSPNIVSQCFEINNFIFTNQSTITSGIFTSSWNFGDGATSALLSPAHTYSASGVYVVKLVVASSDGCKDSTTKTVTVNKQPVSSFTINDSTQCLNKNSFGFSSTSVVSGNGVYQWTFGDATTASSASPSHVYAAAGTFPVKLVVTSGDGCKDSVTRQVIVYPKVTSSFSITQLAQCFKGNNFTFNNTSTVSAGSLSMAWSFGDGTLSTQTNASHHYNTSGVFQIRSVATSNNGCTDTANNSVTVNAMPAALFNINTAVQCFDNNNFVFSNVSTGSGSLAYQWKFGDGNTASTVNTSHHYNLFGSYPVTLVVTTSPGCTDTIVKTAVVNPQPVASFNIVANGVCANNNNYTFTNTTNIGAGTFSNQWAFGDGATSALFSPTHRYGTGGTFLIQLIVLSDKGCRDTTRQPVVVKPKPVVAFGINQSNQCVNTNSYVFTNASTGSAPVIQQWSFGDTGAVVTSVNATHIYTTDGAYNVKLLVSANGCSDSLTKPIVVYPKPTVTFTVNDDMQCLVQNNFAFANGSSITSGTLQYTWLFGDSSFSNQISPAHHFARANIFSVKQIAISNFGCKDSTQQNVTVLLNPQAAFGVNNSNQCFKGNNFVFTNNSVSPAGTIYSWSFGDGGNSSSFSPSKTYANARTYQVTLFLTANNGCKSDTATTSVSVFPNPVVNAGPDLVVLDGKTVTINASATDALTYAWSPATYLNSAAVKTPIAFPRQNIGYLLTATGNNGCTGSDSVYIKVLKQLNVPNVFSPNGDGVNDTWVIKSLADYPGCTVEVFNRYGLQVFISNGYAKPWDGTYKGNPLPVGTYYYIIEPKNGVDKVTGYVVILR